MPFPSLNAADCEAGVFTEQTGWLEHPPPTPVHTALIEATPSQLLKTKYPNSVGGSGLLSGEGPVFCFSSEASNTTLTHKTKSPTQL